MYIITILIRKKCILKHLLYLNCKTDTKLSFLRDCTRFSTLNFYSINKYNLNTGKHDTLEILVFKVLLELTFRMVQRSNSLNTKSNKRPTVLHEDKHDTHKVK